MINEKETTKISKLLSLVLRHQPDYLGITLDEAGWTDVVILMEKAADAGVRFDLAVLKHVVETNNKKRFAFNDDFTKIRANQGHSVEVELGYSPQTPPEMLYHGTGSGAVESIRKTGLEKRSRQHVHLSHETETAINVGQRHGKPVVFVVRALEMHNDGFAFFLSDNGVWLTDHVPVKYLELR